MWQSKQSCHWWDCNVQGACTFMPMFVPSALNNLLTSPSRMGHWQGQKPAVNTKSSAQQQLRHAGSPWLSWFLLVILAPPGSSWLSWLLLVILVILAPPGYPGHPGFCWLSWLLLVIFLVILAPPYYAHPPGSLNQPGFSWLPWLLLVTWFPHASRNSPNPPRFPQVLLGSPMSSWALQGSPGLPCRPFVEGPGYPGSSWLLLAPPGSPWLLLAPPVMNFESS
jgi:hypothetical protein